MAAIFSAGVEVSAISSLEFCLRMMRSVIVAAPRCKSICCFAVSCLDESPLFLHVRRLMAVGDGPVTGAADATSSPPADDAASTFSRKSKRSNLSSNRTPLFESIPTELLGVGCRWLAIMETKAAATRLPPPLSSVHATYLPCGSAVRRCGLPPRVGGLFLTRFRPLQQKIWAAN